MSSFGRTPRSMANGGAGFSVNSGIGRTSPSSGGRINSDSNTYRSRPGSEDLYVSKPYGRNSTNSTSSAKMSTPRRVTTERSPADPPKYSTFGTKDPLSYGTKVNSTSTGTSSTPKYEFKGRESAGIALPKGSVAVSAPPEGKPRKIFSGAVGRGVAKKFIPGRGAEMNDVKQKGVQDYETLKRKCLEANVLFEDDAFPAKDSSLFFSLAGKQKLVWKRPKEICQNPKFFVDGVSRFDVKQGRLGNCWFLAAVGNLTIYEELFYNVVPKDNTYDKDYCGIFHFRFWQYGSWVDIVVDDRLPYDPVSKELVYMHSNDSNEFWGALMEKAYAKIHGSYEALDGGSSNEALQDFCGGIVEIVMINDLKDKDKNDLANLIDTGFKRHSFICCAVEGHAGITEAITSDGLVHGHAYTMTAFKRIDIGSPRRSVVTLVRIRNPWGSDQEWNGAWSDGSKEWNSVSEETKRALDLQDRKDGEFWMSIEDFKQKFYKLDICNLSPALYQGVAVEGKKWNESDFNGKWIPYATAGGCTNFINMAPFTYAMNPQYIVEFDTPDADGDPNKCTVLIGLVQKNRRAKKKDGVKSLPIGYAVYSLDGVDDLNNPLDLDFFKKNQVRRLVGTSGKYTNTRVVNARFELAPGKYCIVPTTFDPKQDGEFVLRVFSESANRITENAGTTEMDDDEDAEEEVKPKVKLTREEETKRNSIAKLFDTTAGEDQEIGWASLKQLLDNYLKKEFKFNGFSGEVCRSMVALLDKDRSGKIGPEEFQELWSSILTWKNTFKKFDEDHSNTMSSLELRKALKSCGINLSNRTLETLVLRYGNDNGLISFEDFIMCTVKLSAMMGTFKKFQSADKGNATFSLEDWLEKTIYS